MKKKLNAVTVSGLMIGPILGSGIVFLPPLAYGKLGDHAIIAWLIMMALGALFAYVFAKITSVVPDNQGISLIVGNMLGDKFRVLSANYLTAAVLFGPAAVALTAADFIRTAFPSAGGISLAVTVGAVLLVCALLVLSGASFMGKCMLVLSSITACLLLVCGLATLLGAPVIDVPHSLPAAGALGHTLLLIFWSIVGWEVMGNYVEDVSNPARTMMRAMKISLCAIVLIYLLTSFALQVSHHSTMATILEPVFGLFSVTVFGILAAGLCICTVVTFTGAVARQTESRVNALKLPPLLKKKWMPVLALLAVNLVVLALNSAGWLTFENIVGIANTLFIGNAFLGLLAGFRLIRSVFVGVGIGALLLMLVMLFLFSSVFSILLFSLITVFSLFYSRRHLRQTENPVKISIDNK